MAICICNYRWNEKRFFRGTVGVSETVPDQSLSIAEIFQRLRDGMSLDNLSRSYYDDSDDFNDDYESVDVLDSGHADLTDFPSGYEVV